MVEYGAILHIPVSGIDNISIDLLNSGAIIDTIDVDVSDMDEYEFHLSRYADAVIVYNSSNNDIVAIYDVVLNEDKYWMLNNSDNVDYPLGKVILER